MQLILCLLFDLNWQPVWQLCCSYPIKGIETKLLMSILSKYCLVKGENNDNDNYTFETYKTWNYYKMANTSEESLRLGFTNKITKPSYLYILSFLRVCTRWNTYNENCRSYLCNPAGKGFFHIRWCLRKFRQQPSRDNFHQIKDVCFINKLSSQSVFRNLNITTQYNFLFIK